MKTKQKVTDQKLQQAEDTYSQAKQLYDEITDELYEELPNFFDRYVCSRSIRHRREVGIGGGVMYCYSIHV